MVATADNRFINSFGARVVALAIGICLVVFMAMTWGDEMQKFANSFGNEQSTPLVQPVGEERVITQNPALETCLEERVGHVDQMLEDGVINEHQHGQFTSRATSLCKVQNPG